MPMTMQNMESREAVFEMPAEPGQIPAIFAGTAAAEDPGDSSDCEILSDDPIPDKAPAYVL